MTSLFSGDMQETAGTVTEAVETVNADKQKEYDVTVSYSVNGREYTNTFYGMGKAYSVGEEIRVFYDAADPNRISNSGSNGMLGIGLIAAGIAALVLGVLRTAKAFQKSRELDQKAGKAAPAVDFGDYKKTEGVREIYCRYDGNTLRPGYILEDADRNVLFEGSMTKNALMGARTFQFTDHASGAVSEHEVGHPVTEKLNDEFFSASSWFKYDGKNIWNVLHERGLRITTNILSSFPNLIYEVSRNGAPYARIETSGMYVHEDEEKEHKVNIPVGRYYYRIWTASEDYETIFLTVFAISETEQTMVE